MVDCPVPSPLRDTTTKEKTSGKAVMVLKVTTVYYTYVNTHG